MKKINANFDNQILSEECPTNLKIEVLNSSHVDGVNVLKSFRDKISLDKINLETLKELRHASLENKYLVYIGMIEKYVVGLCRLTLYGGMEKNRYSSPEGWWFQGVLIHPAHRRKNIARELTHFRFDLLREMKVPYVFSAVELNNLASRKMHERFGFELVKLSGGKFNRPFDDGSGYIFKKELEG